MATINTKDFLTSAEAASALQLSTDTIKKYCQKGKLMAEKIGRDWFIYKSEVRRYQQDRVPPGRPERESS